MTVKQFLIHCNKVKEKRIKQRVAVLTSLVVYQEMEEEPRVQRPRYEVIEGHLNGPRAYRKITAFELWREIVMFL